MDTHIYTVTLPDIGEGVVEGEVIQWLKKVGDRVEQDEPIVVVMTDKATVELPTPHPGILSRQHFKAGEIAIKGKPLYDLDLEGKLEKKEMPKEKIKEPAREFKAAAPCAFSKTNGKPESAKSSLKEDASKENVEALPSVRKLAKELGIDINSVSGSGKNGRVEASDLIAKNKFQEKSAAIESRPEESREQVLGIRKLMAKKMAESKRHIPHFSYFEQLDATRLVKLKLHCQTQALKEGLPAVTFMPFFIRALSLTLHKFPKINSSFDESSSELVLYPFHNIGIAVTTPLGLIVPVLKNVENLSIKEIIESYGVLRDKFKENKLQSSDMKGATITISNFGGLQGSGLFATPIINHPEAAILAVGRVQPQPMVKNGSLVVSEALNLSWSFDHRIVDGDMAAAFSSYFSKLLVNPALLL